MYHIITLYMYLFISYQDISGLRKIWYVVHPENSEKFVKKMQEMFKKEYKEGTTYHAHKKIFLDPLVVSNEWNIPLLKICQWPGDIAGLGPTTGGGTRASTSP